MYSSVLIIKREFNAHNIHKFNETLNQTDWGPVYNLEDFNELYSYFQNNLIMHSIFTFL